ncbi:hypothetical protein BgiBS90_006081, partial [Biomphalaria glabrata]
MAVIHGENKRLDTRLWKTDSKFTRNNGNRHGLTSAESEICNSGTPGGRQPYTTQK